MVYAMPCCAGRCQNDGDFVFDLTNLLQTLRNEQTTRSCLFCLASEPLHTSNRLIASVALTSSDDQHM
jgi:hypothetical protein